MINVTVLTAKSDKKITASLVRYVIHFVLLLYFSIWPRPRPQAPGLGLELLASFNISALPLNYTRGAGAPESPRPEYRTAALPCCVC